MSSKNNISNNTSDDKNLSMRVVRGGFWVFLIRIISESLYLAKIIILANILSPHDFGLFGIALLMLDIMKLFSRTGFEAALIQKKEDIESYLDSTWTVIILRNLGLFIIMLLIAPVTAFYFEAPEATLLIQIIGFELIFGAFTNIGFIYFRKELKFSKEFIFRLTGQLIDFFITIYTVLILRNVWAIIIGLLTGTAAKCVISYFLHPYRPHLSTDFKKANELWSFGKWAFISGLLLFLIIEADDVFVGIVLGVTVLGFYQMAYRISNLPATEITNVVYDVTYPAYSKLQDDIPNLREAYLKVLKITAFSSFLIGGLIFAFAFDFTKIFLGDKWYPMVLAMQVLVLWGMIRSVGHTTVSIFQARGKPGIITKILAFQVILMAIFIYPLTIQYNIMGTSASIVFAALISTLIFFYKVVKIIKCGRWDFCKLIILPLINMVIMVLSIFFIKIYWNISIGIIELGMLGVFAILMYFGITLIFEKFFNYKIIKDLFKLYRQLTTQKL
ncbi:MAG: lipopolysaccharide biosynthesis protein [Candidatus Helarchaeota archaeon]|nr:lipopolysaccharide biosynthesis protein [Candidatus Helarchaeota archaeon]